MPRTPSGAISVQARKPRAVVTPRHLAYRSCSSNPVCTRVRHPPYCVSLRVSHPLPSSQHWTPVCPTLQPTPGSYQSVDCMLATSGSAASTSSASTSSAPSASCSAVRHNVRVRTWRPSDQEQIGRVWQEVGSARTGAIGHRLCPQNFASLPLADALRRRCSPLASHPLAEDTALSRSSNCGGMYSRS